MSAIKKSAKRRQLYWYLVEKNAKGRIEATKMYRVPDGEEDVKGIVYVQAYDTEGAVAEATREYARVKSKKRKDRLRKEGKCTCGGERDSPLYVTCGSCRERAAETRERSKLREAGEDVPDGRTQPQKTERLQAKQRDRKQELKLRVYVELRKKLDAKGMTLAKARSLIANEILQLRKPTFASEDEKKTG